MNPSLNAARMAPAELSAWTGQLFGTSSWITLDQARIDAFADCTEDRQWIHCDVARATRESPFGGTVAHGFLTLSLVAPACFEILTTRVEIRQAVNYGLDKVRFLAPVRAGRRVRNHVKILSVEDKGAGRCLLATENTVEIEGEDKPAVIAVVQVLLMN